MYVSIDTNLAGTSNISTLAGRAISRILTCRAVGEASQALVGSIGDLVVAVSAVLANGARIASRTYGTDRNASTGHAVLLAYITGPGVVKVPGRTCLRIVNKSKHEDASQQKNLKVTLGQCLDETSVINQHNFY